MSDQIIQTAWHLVNRIPTHVPAMSASDLGTLLWWVDYFDDSEESLMRKKIRNNRAKVRLIG